MPDQSEAPIVRDDDAEWLRQLASNERMGNWLSGRSIAKRLERIAARLAQIKGQNP